MGTRVAELRKSSVEQAVLLPERLDIGIRVCLFCLKLHVCVGDFRYRRAGSTGQQCHPDEEESRHSQVEHDGEQEDEAGDSQIDPLHILQRILIVTDVIEDGVRSNDRRYNSSDTILSLAASNGISNTRYQTLTR